VRSNLFHAVVMFGLMAGGSGVAACSAPPDSPTAGVGEAGPADAASEATAAFDAAATADAGWPTTK